MRTILAFFAISFLATAADEPLLLQSPTLSKTQIVFAFAGDLWSVAREGGDAVRLTSGTGNETDPMFSPDGTKIAFTGEYDGNVDVFVVPAMGGVPKRLTWHPAADRVLGWTPDGKRIIFTSNRTAYSRYSEMFTVPLEGGVEEKLPLPTGYQASMSADGQSIAYEPTGKAFVMWKRYRGGQTARIWLARLSDSTVTKVPRTNSNDFNPMWAGDKVYFLSDRNGPVTLFSYDVKSKAVREAVPNQGLDLKSASLGPDAIVYEQFGGIALYDLKSGKTKPVNIRVQGDFPELRTRLVNVAKQLMAPAISPTGARALFVARGEIVSVPAEKGDARNLTNTPGSMERDPQWSPDGKTIAYLSDESGEYALHLRPQSGPGAVKKIELKPGFYRAPRFSPDSKKVALVDTFAHLSYVDTETGKQVDVAQDTYQMRSGEISGVWSPDSKWLAFVQAANNQFAQVKVLNVASGEIKEITSDRYDSVNPIWSSDGKWLYFLSDRALKTTVQSPWGPRQPEPFFDHQLKIYQLALVPDLRSPFLPPDELHPDGDAAKDEKKADDKSKDVKKDEKKAAEATKKTDEKKPEEKKDDKKDEKKPPEVKIDFADLSSRLIEVPVPAGNYGNLQATEKRLCWLNDGDNTHQHLGLQCVDLANKGDDVDNVMGDVKGFEISDNRKKMLVRKGDDFYILDSDVKPAALGDAKALAKLSINLSRWTFSTKPVDEYRGIFMDAWRLERDYFYDKNMHGVNWTAMRDRYLPLVDRVANRDELNAVIAQMVGELSALHTFVVGGDARKPADQVDLASLGARLRRDEKAGGFVVEHIYLHDPDLPELTPPLAKPESLVKEGEVIVSMDGQDLLGVTDERALLRGKAGAQVLLKVKNAAGATRDVLVTPMKDGDESHLRYAEWEYSRRMTVEKESNNTIGYVHLQAMGPEDMNQWAREFYPVFDRQGLIIDVRHNGGGNIDSWLLGKLLRKAWFYFQPRVGSPSWNMQYAFRGHIVVLCDQQTASDGEAFTEGFKRLGLGKVIGMRTWGGEVWLSFSNVQADNGIASAAELGVYGPEGKWLIEGHGAEPDIAVDDLPHGTFAGNDEQLQAALKLLKEEIKADPRPVPQHPAYSDKSFKGSGN